MTNGNGNGSITARDLLGVGIVALILIAVIFAFLLVFLHQNGQDSQLTALKFQARQSEQERDQFEQRVRSLTVDVATSRLRIRQLQEALRNANVPIPPADAGGTQGSSSSPSYQPPPRRSGRSGGNQRRNQPRDRRPPPRGDRERCRGVVDDVERLVTGDCG